METKSLRLEHDEISFTLVGVSLHFLHHYFLSSKTQKLGAKVEFNIRYTISKQIRTLKYERLKRK